MSQEYYNYYNQPEDPMGGRGHGSFNGNDGNTGNTGNSGNGRPPNKGKGKLIAAIGCTALATCLITTLCLSSAFGLDIFHKGQSDAPTATQTSQTAEVPALKTAVQGGNEVQQARQVPQLGGAAPAITSDSTVADIVDAVGDSVVGIETVITNSQLGSGTGAGSGIVISADGYILTNQHVIDNASSVTVHFENGDPLTAEIVGQDATNDVAVLKVDKKDLKAAPIGSSTALRVGDYVIAIGNPTGTLDGSVTGGLVSALNRKVSRDGESVNMIQTDAAINPGNSGGALVNMSGQVVGIANMKRLYAGTDDYGNAISAEGIGFAIPIDEAMPIAEQLIKYGKVERPGIGITGATVTLEQAQNWNTPRGVLVKDVTAGGMAEQAGIKVNQIITEANGEKVMDMETLQTIIKSRKLGDKLKLTVWSEAGGADGATAEVEVTIGDMNEMNEAAEKAQTQTQQGQGNSQGNGQYSQIPGFDSFPWNYFFGY